MVLSPSTAVAVLPAKFPGNFDKLKLLRCFSTPKSNFRFKFSLNRNCISNKITNKHSKGFSVLSSDIPWEKGSIWSIMGIYMFNLHIPLGIGGLSMVSYILKQPVLDPQTEVLSLLVTQILELVGSLILLKNTTGPDYKLANFFETDKLSMKRNWLLASTLGFGSLTLLVLLTSFLADISVGPKVVNNPILKEILLSSNISKTACVLVYCMITPMMEEIIYRGFLLRSLASTMNWQKAVFISSAVFSAAHFSGENFLQLFIIGCLLSYCYCWTGNLRSTIAIHSLYNALTLIITFVS